MGLFSKKNDIPKISPAPVLPELPKREHVSSELPSLPGIAYNDNLNQEMIKSAVNNYSSEEEEVKEKEGEDNFDNKRLPLPPSYSGKIRDIENTGARPSMGGTIFVKIDKFNRAQNTLRDVEDKVKEISIAVNTLREIKIKEIKELDLWDEELKKVNSRLSNIDSNIFGEV